MGPSGLQQVLMVLYDAGARDVPADRLAWSRDMASNVFDALTMLYVSQQRTSDGYRFSLTGAGYRAIGKEPPKHASINDAVRWALRSNFIEY